MDGQVIATAASTSTRLRHLPPGTTHTFTVRARDAGGNISGSSNAADRDAAGERRHDAAERAVEPDRRRTSTTSAAA